MAFFLELIDTIVYMGCANRGQEIHEEAEIGSNEPGTA